MRILVAGGPERERKELAGVLRAGGHVASTGADERESLALLLRELPDVVLCLVEGRELPYVLLGQARALPAHDPVVVVASAESDEPWWTAAYEAGADAELRHPYGPAHVLARLRAVQRRLDRARGRAPASVPTRGGSPPVPSPPANGRSSVGSSPSPPKSSVEVVVRSVTWTSARDLLARVAEKFLRRVATPGAAPSLETRFDHAYLIPLVDSTHGIDARVSVGADGASADLLAAGVFGDDAEGLAPDTLSELANLFMAALKTSFSTESIPFASGLPEAIAPSEVLRSKTLHAAEQSFALELGPARLAVHVGVRPRATLLVQSTTLREGMVLVRDVFTARGVLMLAGGTRLSQNMIERLRSALPGGQIVEVMPT